MSKQANNGKINATGTAPAERERSDGPEIYRPLDISSPALDSPRPIPDVPKPAPDVSRPASEATHLSTFVIPGGSVARLVRLNWKLIALVTLALAGIAWIAAAIQPSRYRANALAAVAPLGDVLEANELLRGVEVLERRTVIATIAALATTDVTRARARAGKGYEIEATVLPNTNLFRIEVRGADGAEAAAIANRVPEVLSAQTRAMFKYYGVTLVSAAVGPESPYLPRPGRAILAGLLIGLFLGLLAAYAVQWRAARRGSTV